MEDLAHFIQQMVPKANRLVRYVYIPLGGRKFRVLNTFAIFSFVAYWHDASGILLAWGWLIALFIVPEIGIVKLITLEQSRKYFGQWHLHICALGGALNILAMMSANLVGFAIGVDGFKQLLSNLYSWRGFLFLLNIIGSLFLGVHRMFYNHANSSTFAKSH